MPLHVSSTYAYRQEVKIVLHNLWYHHTYRWPSGAQVERGLNLCRKSNLYSTTSGIITSIGGRLVRRLREDSTCARAGHL